MFCFFLYSCSLLLTRRSHEIKVWFYRSRWKEKLLLKVLLPILCYYVTTKINWESKFTCTLYCLCMLYNVQYVYVYQYITLIADQGNVNASESDSTFWWIRILLCLKQWKSCEKKSYTLVQIKGTVSQEKFSNCNCGVED